MHSVRGYDDEVIVSLACFVVNLHWEAQTIPLGITLSVATERNVGQAHFGQQTLLCFDGKTIKEHFAAWQRTRVVSSARACDQ